MKSMPILVVLLMFILSLLTSQLISSANTSQAFPAQQTTAAEQQQNMTQSNQSAALQPLQQPQQNMTQSNQSAALQPLQQQTVQQQLPLEQVIDSGDFIASGLIDSTIYTINGNWKANGNWKLTVSDGMLTSFDTDMAWNNGTAAHTHEFQNFQVDDDSDNISTDSEGSVTIEGLMDVGTNGIVSWPQIPAEITIEKGKIITVSLDDEDTNQHFGGQAVHGSVTSFKSCSIQPEANMQIPSDGCI
jgi:hypothetical protein